MKKIFYVFIVALVYLTECVHCGCSDYDTCGSCAAYEACYWCASSKKCEDYYEEKFSDIICPKKWVQHASLCPVDDGNSEQLANLLKNSQSNVSPVDALLTNRLSGSNGGNSDLKDLLRKLLLLKLLRKIKTEGTSSLNAQETQLLNQLTNLRNAGNIITTTTTTTQSPDVSNEIKKLLSILQNHNSGEKGNLQQTTERLVVAKLPTTAPRTIVKETHHNQTVSTSKPVLQTTTTASNKSAETVMSLLKKIDEQNAGVVYEESKAASFGKPTPLTKTSIKTTGIAKGNTSSVKPTKTINFCRLYEEVGLCNSDHNCTWCNTRDVCIRRSAADYNKCVDAKSRMKDKTYGLDKCLALKHCKQCVENDKCYWCDVSKSCHTYPFFGYVPQSCGGDWYVKQCDVQLAVIIIVLPLIIILLAMITFYFCLKYCYYRRKILRVPLFEKPGVFDYRKDKKVYYVNPEDESSDAEMAAEKIRKKYRLPVEREPLIDPNS